ncbi:MAG: class I SAM-dependent methyltransferase [Solirubrobacteraceae bacterium]
MTGLSPRLREFVDELPEERHTVLAFVSAVASQLPAGTRILDAGAGNAPYRELFAHCDYVTADWENSPHEHAPVVDIHGSLEDLPLADSSFDVVLSTQVLEHVSEPLSVLRELHRITRPGGRVFLTVPLVWELHEEPFDYFRYTPHGVRHLLTAAGFVVESITPRNGYFTTLASLARTATWTIWSTDGGREAERTLVDRLLRGLAAMLPAFDELDEVRRLPLGYACVASRPRQ